MKRQLVRIAVVQILLALLWTLPALAQTAVTRTVTATWTANTESDLAGYELHYGKVSGAYTNKVSVGKVTTASVAVGEGQWFFALKAFDTSNNFSGFSNEASIAVDTTPPVNPGVPTLTVNISVTVSLSQ